MTNYLIQCGVLLDATGADPRPNVDIEVVGDTIAGIVPRGESALADATVVDLSGMTVMPGMIDCHEHLGLTFGQEEYEQGGEPSEFYAVKAAMNTEAMLRAGITTVRSAGDKDNTATVVKRAIEEGIVAGPRLVTARRIIARTGGHGWIVGNEADGPWDVRRAIREEVKAGADVIKIMVSGGASTPGSNVLAPDMTDAEILAAIDEAHRLGRKVMAHGHGGPGVTLAVKAGVDSIEHGMMLTHADFDLMVEHGTTFVATSVYGLELLENTPPDVPQHVIDKVEKAERESLENLRYVATLPLRVAVGTDTVHGRIWQEMKILVEYGFSPMAALRAGTINGAELCGLGERTGTLEVGKFADIIAVDGDPLADFGVAATVPFVMKAGKVFYAPDGAIAGRTA